MGDLRTPPPSYEVATGSYVPPTNQFFRSVPQNVLPPSALRSNDETILLPIGPILPPARTSTIATPQGNQHLLDKETNTMLRVVIGLICLAFLLFLIVEVTRIIRYGAYFRGSSKFTFNDDHY